MKRLVLTALILSLIILTLANCGGKKDVATLRAEGKMAFQKEQYEEARGLFLEALKTKPTDKELLFLTGVSYERDFFYDSALVYLRRAHTLYRMDREINTHILDVAYDLGRWQECIDAVYVLAETGDGYERWNEKLSELWGRNGHPYNSMYWLKKAMENDPDNMNFYLRASSLAVELEGPDSALTILDNAAKRFGDHDLIAANRATMLSSKKEFKQAEKILLRLIAEDSTAVAYQLNYSNVLTAQDNPAKKRQGLDILKKIRDQIRQFYPVDSMIGVIETELAGGDSATTDEE